MSCSVNYTVRVRNVSHSFAVCLFPEETRLVCEQDDKLLILNFWNRQEHKMCLKAVQEKYSRDYIIIYRCGKNLRTTATIHLFDGIISVYKSSKSSEHYIVTCKTLCPRLWQINKTTRVSSRRLRFIKINYVPTYSPGWNHLLSESFLDGLQSVKASWKARDEWHVPVGKTFLKYSVRWGFSPSSEIQSWSKINECRRHEFFVILHRVLLRRDGRRSKSTTARVDRDYSVN